MSYIFIKNGKIFRNNKFLKYNILIKNKKIIKITKKDIKNIKNNKVIVIDAKDSIISYGFIDPHVHFRTPGYEYKEDWDSGSKAAIKGGFTFVIDMPNTNPPTIDIDTLKYKNNIANKTNINYGFHLGLTDDNSKNLLDIINQAKKEKIPLYGIKCYLGSTTGNLLVKNKSSILKAFETNKIVLFHCEDEDELKKYKYLTNESILDHNFIRPPVAEVSGLNKIINSIKKNKKNAKIYICHASSKQLVKEIIKYKKEGYNIITEVTPHHIYLNNETYNLSNIFKVNPPIRPKKDQKFLIKSFNKNRFNIIGTDHAPHLLSEKESENPPSGFPGLETCFYAFYKLYEKGYISLKKILTLLTNGYKIFNIKKRGKIKKGYYADLVIIKKSQYIFNASNCESKARFSPFDKLKSNVIIDTVIINGKIRLLNNKLY